MEPTAKIGKTYTLKNKLKAMRPPFLRLRNNLRVTTTTIYIRNSPYYKFLLPS